MLMFTKNFEELKFRVRKHVAEDRVTQGAYWNGDRGCFIGCLNHSEFGRSCFAEHRYGLPEELQLIGEVIFEGLPPDEARAFFAALPAAVGCNGKCLNRVTRDVMSNHGWTHTGWDLDSDNRIEYIRRGRDLFLKLIRESPVNPYLA